MTNATPDNLKPIPDSADWFAPFIDYVLCRPCPTCKAPAWQSCDAPAKRAKYERVNRTRAKYECDPVAPDMLNMQHKTRVFPAADRHYRRDVAKAPWPEERVSGTLYSSIDYSGRPAGM